jgi:hypothetical protein
MSARTARTIFGAALAAILLGAAAGAVEQAGRFDTYMLLRKEAAEAFSAGDVPAAESRLIEALAIFPDAPWSYIRLARVQAAAGKTEEALENTGRFAGMGGVLDIDSDPVLAPLKALPGWRDVANIMLDNARPIGEPVEVLRVSARPDWIGEGLVHDGKGGLLLSTVSGRTVARLRDGSVEVFLKADAETGALFGMAVDRRRGLLWVGEAWGAGVPGGDGAARTGLLKVSLADGRILGRIAMPGAGEKRQFGDLVVSDDGAVYASDAFGGVWRLKNGSDALERLLAPGSIGSPQGLVVCPGGKALLVADYSSGLHRLDLETGDLTAVQGLMAGLAGTDGLVAAPAFRFTSRAASSGAFAVVATQNGATPQRVVLLRINRGCSELEQAELVAANQQGLDDLTHVAVDGTTATFIGHARWEARARDLTLARPDPGPILVYSAPVPQPLW